MNAEQILTQQIADQILNRQWILVRAQQPQATDFNAPQVPADWMLVQLVGDMLYSSTGQRISRSLNSAEIDRLQTLRLLEEDRWNENDFWQQYAKEFDLHEKHTNTDPIIWCLPAQPSRLIGGKTPQQQFADFFREIA